jgi:hypothetical protein
LVRGLAEWLKRQSTSLASSNPSTTRDLVRANRAHSMKDINKTVNLANRQFKVITTKQAEDGFSGNAC